MPNHNKRAALFFSFFFLAFLILTSCSTDGGDSSPSVPVYQEKRIAVVLPSNSEDEARYRQIVEWCLETFRSVRSRTPANFEIKIDWYGESQYSTTEEFTGLFNKIAYDKELCAIICLVENSNLAVTAAKICAKTEKPLVMPSFSSDEFLRRYSVSETGSITRPFLWSLTESDVTQCEVAMSKVSALGMQKISLLSSADAYGSTYYSWASFLAKELGLELKENIRFKFSDYSALKDSVPETPLDLSAAIDRVLNSDSEVVICAMRNAEDVRELLLKKQAYDKEKEDDFDFEPELFFTDSCITSSIAKLGALVDGIEGTATYIDPGNGFLATYMQKFSDVPIRAAAQLYDSILITIYALAYQSNHADYFSNFLAMSKDANISRNIAMNEAYKKVCVASDQNNINNSWDKTGMIYMLKEYAAGKTPVIEGASGVISFDPEVFTTILYSTYIHWSIYSGNLDILAYMSASGGRRTGSVRADRAWVQTIEQILEGEVPFPYPPKTEQYALLVAASSGWKNYRHQADVLNMYNFLTKHGFDDNHIVMIMQDDIANNSKNKTDKGNIRVSPNGENLYTETARAGIDGKPSELLPEDIEAILLGDSQALKNNHPDFSEEKINRLKITGNESTNIFFFWSGHGELMERNGSSGQLLMASQEQEDWEEGTHRNEGFTTELLKETLEKMSADKKFCQMLIINESCHGKSVFKVAEGIPGVLVYTSANEFEPSFTDVRNTELDVWMTNRFTKNLMAYLYLHYGDGISGKSDEVTYYDLYSSLAKQTMASHVCLINSKNFCNVNDTSFTPADFLIYYIP